MSSNEVQDQFTTLFHHIFTWQESDDQWNKAHMEEMEGLGFRVVGVIPGIDTIEDADTRIIMVKTLE